MQMADARPCPACAHTASEPAGNAGGFGLRRCEACRTLFTDRLPSPDEALDYDSYYHEGNLEVPAFVLGRLEDQVREFAAYRHSNRWLDVGCGAGTLMEAASRQGWEPAGTEVAHGAAEAVRAKGFAVHVGELDELELPPGGYDVVSLVEVVEHVPEPRPLIAAAVRLLRPGGALFVTTPHGRGISGRLLGDAWSVVAPPEHLQLFSLPGLESAVGAAGLAVETVRTHATNPDELVRALLRRPALSGDERVETGYRLNETLSVRRRGRLVKELANGVLRLTRLGDSIRLVARRPA